VDLVDLCGPFTSLIFHLYFTVFSLFFSSCGRMEDLLRKNGKIKRVFNKHMEKSRTIFQSSTHTSILLNFNKLFCGRSLFQSSTKVHKVHKLKLFIRSQGYAFVTDRALFGFFEFLGQHTSKRPLAGHLFPHIFLVPFLKITI